MKKTKYKSLVFFLELRKAYSFKCGDDNKSKLKGIFKPQSKHIKFESYKKCLDRAKYQQECDNYILRSLNHEFFLQ